MLQVQSKPCVALCAQFSRSPVLAASVGLYMQCWFCVLSSLYDSEMFILQPPWDLSTRKFFIIHYTYGCDYNLKVKLNNILFKKNCYSSYDLMPANFFAFRLILWIHHLPFPCHPVSYLRLHNLQGQLTCGKIGEWRFDKRSYLRGPPPKNLSLPPPGVPESVVRFEQYYNIFAVYSPLLGFGKYTLQNNIGYWVATAPALSKFIFWYRPCLHSHS